jgi:hypothetical protein
MRPFVYDPVINQTSRLRESCTHRLLRCTDRKWKLCTLAVLLHLLNSCVKLGLAAAIFVINLPKIIIFSYFQECNLSANVLLGREALNLFPRLLFLESN